MFMNTTRLRKSVQRTLLTLLHRYKPHQSAGFQNLPNARFRAQRSYTLYMYLYILIKKQHFDSVRENWMVALSRASKRQAYIW